MNWIRSFDAVGMADIASVGGKNASLGELRRALTPLGIRTPDGFATTADAYKAFMQGADLECTVRDALGSLDVGDIDALQAAGARITGAYGLGESVVQGTVNPDEFYVFKPTLTGDLRPILQKTLGTKEFKLVYEEGGTRQTRSVPVSGEDRARFVLTEDDVLTLARWAVLVERHYSQLRSTPTPMDIEWAKDGRTGDLYLVQARPETVHTRRDAMVLERFHLDSRGELLLKGRSVGEKIGQGPARVIRSSADLEQLQSGGVLVTEMTDPDWEPVMKRAAFDTNRQATSVHESFLLRRDERNDAVKQTIAQVIRAAHAAGRTIGICGQAPSDYPDFAQFLVAERIDSISLNPDSVLKTMVAIVETENRSVGSRTLAETRA